MLIHKRTIHALQAAAVSDDHRYALAAIRVEPTGECVATDGHVLLRATTNGNRPDPAEYPSRLADGSACDASAELPDGATLATGVLIAAAKACPKPTRYGGQPILQHVVVIPDDDEGHRVIATDLDAVHAGRSRVEGQYPEWRRVFEPAKAAERIVSVTLGVPVLEKIIKAAKVARASKENQCVTFHFAAAKDVPVVGTDDVRHVPTEEQAVYLEIGSDSDGPTIDGVAMPMR